MLAFLTRRARQETPTPEPVTAAETDVPQDDDNVLMRFITQGGATVELHPTRFTAKFDYRGAPYAVSEPYKVDGFNWRCTGCAAFGREDETYYELGFRTRGEARDEANEHATACRSMPKNAA
ncbi:hypothetical protein ACFC8N_42755 [Streptomyces sp. NPDC055966]|uniref:hypothetical protein n=1 Tax=Streptomyces sp. NPDC055966 TaxID=3345669 RepID=UPI0035D81756